MTMQDEPTTHDGRSGIQSRWRRRPRGLSIGVVLMALAVGLLAPTGASAASAATAIADGSTGSATETTCAAGSWPWAVQGAPAFSAGSAAGVRFWHSATGFHLRVTHPNAYRAVFSGTIRANHPIHVSGHQLETEDAFTVSADGLSVTYRFINHGGIDGIDFTTDCATRLGVSSRMNGVLPVRRIWLGHAGRHPLQNPFVITRRA